jgi:hypothetical protein
MVHKGETVHIKPEWQDKGDDKFQWIALEDEDGGRIRIMPLGTGLAFPPNYVVQIEWLA